MALKRSASAATGHAAVIASALATATATALVLAFVIARATALATALATASASCKRRKPNEYETVVHLRAWLRPAFSTVRPHLRLHKQA